MVAGGKKKGAAGQLFAAREQNGLQASVLAFQSGDGRLSFPQEAFVANRS